MKIEKNEWDQADEKAQEELKKYPAGFNGMMKIDRKKYNLPHSFMAVVENGQIKDMMGMARKKVVNAVGDGILGEGAFSVVALAVTRDGTEYAMKIQGGPNKHAIQENLVKSEMRLLQAASELKAEGFLNNKTNKQKHYAFMKKKQGNELLKEIYSSVLIDEAITLHFKGKKVIQSQNNQWLVRNDLSRKQQLLLAIKCLQGIEYLHTKGIVHRDIKPENIMAKFGDEDHKDIIIVSPTDYGLSQQLKPREEFRNNVNPSGTPLYMAPEVRGNQLCKANDIYSLGVMFRDDFGMNDRFINRMIANTPGSRPTATECREHFEAELKKELETEFNPLLNFRNSKGPSSKQIDEKMKLLLADEATLLKELSGELQNNSQKLSSSELSVNSSHTSNIENAIDRLEEVKTNKSAKEVLVDGFKLIVNILVDPSTRTEIKAALQDKVSALGERIKSLFSSKEKHFNDISENIRALDTSSTKKSSRHSIRVVACVYTLHS
ncbi:MAG: protein kinase family protein [Gammaproteobacteria bacterium]